MPSELHEHYVLPLGHSECGMYMQIKFSNFNTYMIIQGDPFKVAS
jgi:hypothetical protein